MLTRTSVLCADKMVAASSWNGSSNCSAHNSFAVPGYTSARRSTVSRARPFAVLGFATGSRYRVTLAAVDAEDMTVVDLQELDPAERAALTALLERAGADSGHPPLPEPQQLAITHPTGPAHEGRIVLAGPRESLVAFAVLSPARDGSTGLHVVVDPAAASPSLHAGLVRRALEEVPPEFPVHLWVMQAGPGDDERAGAEGFVPERDLLQMRVPLPLAHDVVAATRPLATRPFVPGRDEGPWLETNNRAFVGHPEQSGWTLGELRERMAADWVELD